MLLPTLCALCAWTPVAPLRARGGTAAMVLDDTYWDSKAARVRVAFERDQAALEEFEDRERIYIERLRAAGDRARALEAALESTKLLGAAPEAAESDVTQLESLERENNELRHELSVIEERHQTELKRDTEMSGALLLSKLSESEAQVETLRTELADLQMKQQLAAAAVAPGIPAGKVTSSSSSEIAAAQARVAALEAEINGLEEDYEALTDRLEVQGETIVLANMRLDEVAVALDEQALKAEQQLQRTSAFWIEKLRESESAAVSMTIGAPSPAPPTQEEEEDTTVAELMTEFADALEEATLLREVDVQKVAAYWLDKVAALKAELVSAREAVGTPGADVEGPNALEARVLSAESNVDLLAQALESKTLQAEQELQKVSAFWIERLRAAEVQASAQVAAATTAASAQQSLAELRSPGPTGTSTAAMDDLAAYREEVSTLQVELIEAYDEGMTAAALQAEIELQSTAAFWIARERELRNQLQRSEAANAELTAKLETSTTSKNKTKKK